jgi:hypothetical protein
MTETPKRRTVQHSAAERQSRDQEVLRAKRELAEYFKGRRTEREARAALKTIKAFVRDRERLDAASRPPLPGALRAKAAPARRRKSRPRKAPTRRTPATSPVPDTPEIAD